MSSSRFLAAVLALPLLLCAGPAAADAPPARLRRFALLVGTNDGGEGRLRLRYAVTDAQSMARVLDELGGVAAQDRTVLVEAGRTDVDSALEQLRAQLASVRPGVRTEVLVYYSGHADEEGLLLKGERLSYAELRRALERLPADVRIAILDSCASGAFARRKGGARRPAFLVDSSSSVRGHAILTSSSEDEVSQESDRIGGSFFTHHLVSGLRGAADLSRDGRVTLNEAYHFAFNETLARTEKTKAGPQHPAYDIELAGSGDLVMTDLRATSAGLVLSEELEGRLAIRDAQDALVVELAKHAGRPTELGLAPGHYSVLRESGGARSRAEVVLVDGRHTALAQDAFRALATEVVATRGGGAQAGAPGGGLHSTGTPPSADAMQRAWVNVGVMPGMDTNGNVGWQVMNHVSLGLISSHSTRLWGGAMALMGTWTDQDTRGAQLALGTNVSGGELLGAQVALVGNTVGGRLLGMQTALAVNSARERLIGAQLAVGANLAGARVDGVQLSVGGNVAAGELTGWQSAVLFNWAGMASRGMQTALVANFASQLQGAQFSLVNVGGDVEGMQVGLVNVARRVMGTQIGLVNLADEMNGFPLGLLSLARNGQLHLELYASDLHPAHAMVKFGTRYGYTLIHAGTDEPWWRNAGHSFGLGWGAHVPLGAFFADVEASLGLFRRYRNNSISGIFTQARLVAGWQVAPRLALIAGPTFNVLTGTELEQGARELTFLSVSGRRSIRYWPGFTLGLRI